MLKRRARLLKILTSCFQKMTHELSQNLHGEFDFDVVATGANAPANPFSEEQTFRKDWTAHSSKKSVLFIPADLKESGRWLAKAVYESRKGTTVIGILPVEIHKPWFHKYIQNVAAEVRFISMPRFTVLGYPLFPETIAVVIYRPFKGVTSFTTANTKGEVTGHLN
jgi:hypothetical protein